MNTIIKDRDNQLKKIGDTSLFEINQLKNRIKDLQTMAIAN